MKTLIIYPESTVDHEELFHIFDPETGEILESHYCSHAGWAKKDLHDNNPRRLEKYKRLFGEETEAKFIDETSYKYDDVAKKIEHHHFGNTLL
jgi:hypothetical protein